MTKTEIYYFSETGNSLVVARDIAEKPMRARSL
jgi:flavodoxin